MTEIKVSSVEDLIERLNQLPNNYIYRGHADADWTLQPSLERVIGARWSAEYAKTCEDRSIGQFKSKFHLYDHVNVQPQSKLAWLSIMQHYGVPTRLLDFTESPYVALYFALESYMPELSHDLAVFAIDYSAIMKCSTEYIEGIDGSFKATPKSLSGWQDEAFETVVDQFLYEVAWVTEPNQLNARLDRQAGTFLLSGNPGLRLEKVLQSKIYSRVPIIKYRIAPELYTGIFALLRKMNITSKSLYGDLDGLARWIRMELKVYAALY